LLIIGSKESLSEHSGYAQHPTFYASNIGKGYTGGIVLKKIWNDPVWSKVIASVIIAGAGWLTYRQHWWPGLVCIPTH